MSEDEQTERGCISYAAPRDIPGEAFHFSLMRHCLAFFVHKRRNLSLCGSAFDAKDHTDGTLDTQPGFQLKSIGSFEAKTHGIALGKLKASGSIVTSLKAGAVHTTCRLCFQLHRAPFSLSRDLGTGSRLDGMEWIVS